MTLFYNSHTKKNNRDKTDYINKVVLGYSMASVFFWIFLSLFFYFYLYDPTYGTNAKLVLTSSYSLFFKSLFVIFLTLIFASIIGIVLSLPAIFVKTLLSYKLFKRKQRGQKPVILIFSTRYIPLFILFLFNVSFLFFNFSVAPEMVASFLSQKNIIVSISNKIHSIFFSKNTENFFDYGRIIGEKFPQDSSFIFLIPDDILNNSNNFILSKILLKNSHKLLLTNSYKLDTISSLFHFYSTGYYSLFTPVPVELPQTVNIDKKIFLGVDAENSYNFHSLFGKVAQVEEINLTWFDVFLNKFSFSQPQFLYFFKSGFAGYFNPLWRWSNMYSSNLHLLQKYSDALMREKNSNYNKFALYLTEFDNGKKISLVTQYNKKKLSQLEYKKELKQEDLALARYIGGLLTAGITNINILPYQPNTEQISLTNFYSYNERENELYLFENIIEISVKNSCQPKIINFNNLNYQESIINKLKYSSGNIYFDKKYEFYIQGNLREAFICRFNNSQNYVLVRDYTNFNPSGFSYGEVFSSLFENYTEKISSLKQIISKNKIPKEKTNELFQNEFFNQFKIFKIDSNFSKMTLFQNTAEKELFFKNYGEEVMHEIFEYSNK
ncbi:MAG: hypothetical protein V4591_03560 [Bdellovibrionota bacterium]